MKENRKKKKNRTDKKAVNIGVLFALFMFIALFITNIVSFVVIFFLVSHNVISIPEPENMQPFPDPGFIMFLIRSLLISLILGTCSTLFLAILTTKPINTLTTAINELANGNFNVRIHMAHDRIFGPVNESFNKMAEELSSVEILRNNFINDFSHEFKTPIVSIRGFSRLLQSSGLSEDERQEYLSIIISECERLSSLSNNILNLSKIENQKIISNTQPFYLSEQIRRSILLLETKWAAKNIDFDLDLENFIFTGNRELLQEVWINLISNAIKFSPNRGTIEITLKQNKDKKQIYFKIKDYGCGISEKDRRHIFQRFYQADQSRTTEGNGLGLTIAAKVIELHNGKLQLGTPEEIGTSFEIFLPHTGCTTVK